MDQCIVMVSMQEPCRDSSALSGRRQACSLTPTDYYDDAMNGTVLGRHEGYIDPL